MPGSLRERAYPPQQSTYPPSQAELEAKAEYFLKTSRAKEYRAAKKSGELQEWIQIKVKAAKEMAESLIGGGVWEGEAWNRAIRSQILESESD